MCQQCVEVNPAEQRAQSGPHVIELTGSGWPGIRIGITMKVVEGHPGTCFHLLADLSGGLLNGPVGRFVARVLESDVRRSVGNLAALA